MEWPREKHPQTTRYALIEALHKFHVITVLILLLSGYILINNLYAFLYYITDYLDHEITTNNCFEYIYFSFITGSTIGFEESIVLSEINRIIVIFQGMTSTLYFAMMISFLSIKALYPRHTLHFSDKIVFNEDKLSFRILNSHRALLINPEVRISVVRHCHGNVIAPNIAIAKIDNLHWLDNHDFSYTFQDYNSGFYVSRDWMEARNSHERSRFKIRITISGLYGSQYYTQVVNYGVNDITTGHGFAPIEYNNEDKRLWRNIRFYKFGSFWEEFNRII